MKRWLMVILCCVALRAEILKEHYILSKDPIMSYDLFPQSPSFVIASFGESFELHIKASDLQRLFASKGFAVDSKIKEVRFTYHLPWDSTKLKEEISKTFLAFYASYHPKIQEVRLKPLKALKSSDLRLIKAQITEKMLRKNRFVAMVEVQEGGKHSLQPFFVEIVASLEAYVAKRDLSAGENLGEENVELKRVPFDSIPMPLADKGELKTAALRSFVAKDQMIFKSKLKPRLLVRRGEWVDASYKEGGVEIEARMEAMQNGSMNDEVMVRNLESKKQIRAKVIGERKVVIW
ncbi:flagellar basal body P-ring formation chaperone FlgA [Helicobacter pametensis]|uniref:flagellar basal body P-ring formation chaperone FlgA n=1 Tax=Helicobacter pametensis TaxID=95149 RepID=UPI000485218A|nr:flagellar basal body P-ring formation chaperone FlgA [Helicobacter pametensis]